MRGMSYESSSENKVTMMVTFTRLDSNDLGTWNSTPALKRLSHSQQSWVISQLSSASSA